MGNLISGDICETNHVFLDGFLSQITKDMVISEE